MLYSWRRCWLTPQWVNVNATKWNNNNIFLTINPSNTWKLYLDHQLHAVLRSGVLYWPPPSTQNGLVVSMFFDEFPALLKRLAVASGKLSLLGDFNFHIDDTANRQASNFLELLNNHNLVQHIIGPTHKDSHTLDLVITRASEDTILRWSIMDPHLSDHKVIHAKLSLVRPRPQRIEKHYCKLRSSLSQLLKLRINREDLS